MKKRITALILSAMLCLSLAACGKIDYKEKSNSAKADFISTIKSTSSDVDAEKMYDMAVTVTDTSIVAKVPLPGTSDRNLFEVAVLLTMSMFNSIGKQFDISEVEKLTEVSKNSSGTSGNLEWSYTAPTSIRKEMTLKISDKN